MNLRFNAIQNLGNVTLKNAEVVNQPIAAHFAENVFTPATARKYVDDDVYKSLQLSITAHKKIDRRVASQIANGLKNWAKEKGVTHFTHWFQPLTGTTAEKHDSFFTLKSDGTALEEFDGNALIQQEPDASSFPSGGLRATFEARGYTAWDPSSPAFIIEIENGRTLCIPTIYVSYTGESLDYKAPLLKALTALDQSAVAVCRLFDKNIHKVSATLGWEQEYFVVDEALANARPDLTLCDRTVFGASPAKGQQLEDHYFGSIPPRVYAFMREYETECYKLGIPLRTRHNEVAPSQFECAPIYEDVNIAVDHNSLLMYVMTFVAKKHKLKLLLHEKPFASINGSGKHNNWSLATNTGINLLSPGKTPKNNLLFLTFFVNVIKAVHTHADLLRSSIASAGNDFRLGANEAPPAIISVFIGHHLTKVLSEIANNTKLDAPEEEILKMDLLKNIPELLLDNTDRNRTSPFAFTGNKFEFRAVGSSANCANAMTVLNSIMANTLQEFKTEVDALIKTGQSVDTAVMNVLQQYITSSKVILFEGDGYSTEWETEAAKRKLPNVKTTPLALDAMITTKAKDLFQKNGVYTHSELEARHEIELEKYIKKVAIEARIMSDLSVNHILPLAIAYQNVLLQNLSLLNSLHFETAQTDTQRHLVELLAQHISGIKKIVYAMRDAKNKANELSSMRQKAIDYCDKVKQPFFDQLRYHVDELETIIPDQHWTLPKYRELLFLR